VTCLWWHRAAKSCQSDSSQVDKWAAGNRPPSKPPPQHSRALKKLGAGHQLQVKPRAYSRQCFTCALSYMLLLSA
jgi:hypothetical protein